MAKQLRDECLGIQVVSSVKFRVGIIVPHNVGSIHLVKHRSIQGGKEVGGKEDTIQGRASTRKARPTRSGGGPGAFERTQSLVGDLALELAHGEDTSTDVSDEAGESCEPDGAEQRFD